MEKCQPYAVQSFKQSKCPLARVPGFHKVVATILGIADPAKRIKLVCPPPIVAMRAALSALPQVRALRPRPLQEKLAAVAVASLLCNLPMGAWREHTRKFSFEWFVALHASIPFVISLRKAVVLPRAAIIVTIGSAVLGQYIGSRTERRRVAGASEGEAGAGMGGGRARTAGTRSAGGAAAGADDDGEDDGGWKKKEKKKLRVGGGGGSGLSGLPALRGMAPPPPHPQAAAGAAAAAPAAYGTSKCAPRQGVFRPLFSPVVFVK